MILILGLDESFDFLTPTKSSPLRRSRRFVVSGASGSNFGSTDDLVGVLSEYLIDQLMACMFSNTEHVSNALFGIRGKATAVELVVYFLIEVESEEGLQSAVEPFSLV